VPWWQKAFAIQSSVSDLCSYLLLFFLASSFAIGPLAHNTVQCHINSNLHLWFCSVPYLLNCIFQKTDHIMKQMKNLFGLWAMAIMFIWSCGTHTDQSAAGTDDASTAALETDFPTAQIKIYEAPPSQEFPDAHIESWEYKDGTFKFVIGGESYQLGVQTPDAPQRMCANSAKGQHIHLIIDNKPYAAKYEPEFAYEIENGEHYMLAFLSRSYHESLKTPQAHVAQKITVKDGSVVKAEDIEGPMLFYSRPKGTYVGDDTKKLLLDFYIINAELGPDSYKVKVDVNDGQFTTILDKWAPYFIEGLPMGDNKIRLTLLDKDGQPVDAPLNPVERVFTLKPDNTPQVQ